MKNREETTRGLIISLLQEYPDSSFALGREASVDALTKLLSQYSVWALGQAVEAFLEGQKNGVADPTWFPSGPVLRALTERIEEAGNVLEGRYLESTIARLKQLAIDALPTPCDVRRNAESWRSVPQGNDE